MRRAGLAAAALVLMASPACYVFEEGKQQGATFISASAPAEIRERSVFFLGRRLGYAIVDSGRRVVAEKATSPSSFDVIRVETEQVTEGTRVTVVSLTDEIVAGSRRQARYVSRTAVSDGDTLVRFLMDRIPATR